MKTRNMIIWTITINIKIYLHVYWVMDLFLFIFMIIRYILTCDCDCEYDYECERGSGCDSVLLRLFYSQSRITYIYLWTNMYMTGSSLHAHLEKVSRIHWDDELFLMGWQICILQILFKSHRMIIVTIKPKQSYYTFSFLFNLFRSGFWWPY